MYRIFLAKYFYELQKLIKSSKAYWLIGEIIND